MKQKYTNYKRQDIMAQEVRTNSIDIPDNSTLAQEFQRNHQHLFKWITNQGQSESYRRLQEN